MQLNPLAEEVKVTILMKGFRSGFAKTEAFRGHPSTSEEAVDVAVNAEFNGKADRYGRQCSLKSSTVKKNEPMDLSYAEDEAELHAAEQ